MKNFDCNMFHPNHAYNNHSYNNSNNNGSGSNNSTCLAYQQQQLLPAQQQRHHPYQRQQQSTSQQIHQQQQPLQQRQTQHQNQQPLQQQTNLLQRQQQQQQLQQQFQPTYTNYQTRQPPTLQQSQQLTATSAAANTTATIRNSSSAVTATAATANSFVSSNNNINNNINSNSNSNTNALHMQTNAAVSSYANLLSNYNQNIQNNKNNNNNNNTINQQHVATQQQHVAANASTTCATTMPSATVDKFTMDACEIANFLANELFMQQLASVDGIQSGVPTLTTSTLTPTTLRSIEETFIQLTSETINPPFQAGFIPPSFTPYPSTVSTTSGTTAASESLIGNTTYSLHDYNETYGSDSEDSQMSSNADHLNEENSMATTDTSSAATDSTSCQNGLNGLGNNSTSSTNDFTAVNIALAAAAAAAAAKNGGIHHNKNTSTSATTTTTRRNQGGRRPNKSANMSPEEEEKRRVRRERNKLAAARCRKRRVDQTNELLDEVAILEKKREVLQKDIENLNSAKQDLEMLLDMHKPNCQQQQQQQNQQQQQLQQQHQQLSAELLGVRVYGANTITGMDATLAATSRSESPLDLKPVLLGDSMLDMEPQIKHEPLDAALDSGSSLDNDGPPASKRMLLTGKNPMIPPPLPLPNVSTLSPALAAAASASLNTPIMTTAPISFHSFSHSNSNATLNALNKPQQNKQRPNTLPTMPRHAHLGLHMSGANKQPPTDINGVAIQTPSSGMFNFDSLMDGGTGLTPVSGPLVPTCSSQNKLPLELPTPTSEPSKLVSL